MYVQLFISVWQVTPARLEVKDHVITRSFSGSIRSHSSDDNIGDSSSDDDAGSSDNTEHAESDSDSTENMEAVESYPGGASPGSPEMRETRSSKLVSLKRLFSDGVLRLASLAKSSSQFFICPCFSCYVF